MKSTCTIFSICFILICNQISAQVIPDSLRVDWSHAGFQGAIPDTSFIINVKDFGAYGDSIHDDYNAIMNAMNSSTAFRILYFPAGNYLIKSPVTLPSNIILRGDGSSSNLLFDLSAYQKSTDCITINKNQKSSYTNISSGYNKNSASITVVNATGFTVNGYAEIRENNGDWDPDKTSSYVGQMVKITAIDGNTLTFEPALRLDYIDSLQPKIRPVSLMEKIGLECFKLTRLDKPGQNYSGKNISLQYANNCWITGVESNFCQTAHIILSSCAHIKISGCYVHDAYTYNGGGQAYGIFTHAHSSDCIVENCIGERLRHAFILADGANGNVYAYNYSTDPRSTTEFPSDNIGDLSLHGHYAYANLVEGNIVQNLIVDDYWGASGPYNTFFRNREELYGIEILDQYNYKVKSTMQNIVGNEVTGNGFMKGSYIIQTPNNFTYNNNIKGTIQPANTNILNEASYYLTARPYFWDISSTWPSVGGNNSLSSGSIPAKERYFSGSQKTSCSKEPAAPLLKINITADSIICNGSMAHVTISASGGIQPYNGIGDFCRPSGSYSFIVTDAFGNSDTANITLNQPVPVSATINTIATQSCSQGGSILITGVNGGSQPYLFSLNNIDYTQDSTYSNLAYGNYTAYVKDSVGCIDTIQNILIETVPTITVTATATKASSCRNDATITVKQKGGVPPLQYSLNNIDFYNSNSFTNMAPGFYTAFVRDKNRCLDSLTGITVTQLPALKITAKKTDLICKNSDDGIITLTAQGGLKPYLYTIDSINYVSSNVFTNLMPGTYKAGFKDAKSCSLFSTVTIRNSRTTCTLVSSTNKNIQLNNDLKIVVAPNPSTKEFMLTINNHDTDKTAVVVTDMFGRVVYNTNGETKKNYVFGEAFLPGIYILKLVQGDNVSTYKLVKQ